MKRQAVITGLGIVSPIGVGVQRFWEAALAGRSGITTPTLFDASKLPRECQIVGEVADFNVRDWMPGAAGKMAGRFSQFAVAAAKMARDDSGLDHAEIPPERIKVSLGTSISGQIDIAQSNFVSFLKGQTISPWASNEYSAHAATSHVAIDAGARGQTTTFSTACAAGLDAVAWAATQVAAGDASAVAAGATEAPLSEFILSVFKSVGVLSRWLGPPEEASRPFDRLRAGLVLAEGAATVIVEDEDEARTRGAQIYARILGFASASEGAHLRKVDESGETVARALSLAIRRSGLEPREIDFICAHGNSMPDYDAAETAGIKRAFGRHAWNVPVSSLKSMCGQALAASSAMQVVTACLSLRDQAIPPTANYRVPDPQCDLDYVPNRARRARLRNVLIHAHSLGGSHVAMVLRAPD
jgi:3-oxoacyl-[acyl-carrier-protein] synthase II